MEAFEGVQYAFLIGGFPRLAGMLRKDLIAKNTAIFSETGKAIDAVKNIQYSETYQRGVKGVQSLIGMAKLGLNVLSNKLEKYQEDLKEGATKD